jgi:excisionase family DNA binding protein
MSRKLAVPVAPSSINIFQPLAVDLKGAAQLAGVSPFTVREAVGNGSLAAKRAGRTYIIRIADLQKWIDSLAAAPLVPCFVKRAEARKAAA